ncbi:MAG: rubrerythrin family protein [Candidatus Heimdallarchaeota archaeon]|nr:rubrerythrin family protein [Candidatus Heimdallarchaeota archaeon]
MSKSIKGTETEKNLLKAFAGESQARNRYTMYSKIAKKEGFVHISNIFLETADNEYQHAKQFFNFLEGGMVEFTAAYPTDIGTTKENLKFAAMGENEEHTKLYPYFAAVAEKEGFHDVAVKFKMIAKVEVEHERRYLELLKTLEENSHFKKDKKVRWKCSVCGYIHEGEVPPENCPACDHSHEYYELACDNY